MQIFKRKGRPGYYARWQIGGEDFVRATGETSRSKALESLHRFVSEGQSGQSLAEPFQRLLGLLACGKIWVKLCANRNLPGDPSLEQGRVFTTPCRPAIRIVCSGAATGPT